MRHSLNKIIAIKKKHLKTGMIIMIFCRKKVQNLQQEENGRGKRDYNKERDLISWKKKEPPKSLLG